MLFKKYLIYYQEIPNVLTRNIKCNEYQVCQQRDIKYAIRKFIKVVIKKFSNISANGIKYAIKVILNQLWMYRRELARISSAIVRGVYVPRVNHLGVISRPLAPIDITAIDCDLLPNVVQLQYFGHRRLLALQGHDVH